MSAVEIPVLGHAAIMPLVKLSSMLLCVPANQDTRVIPSGDAHLCQVKQPNHSWIIVNDPIVFVAVSLGTNMR